MRVEILGRRISDLSGAARLSPVKPFSTGTQRNPPDHLSLHTVVENLFGNTTHLPKRFSCIRSSEPIFWSSAISAIMQCKKSGHSDVLRCVILKRRPQG